MEQLNTFLGQHGLSWASFQAYTEQEKSNPSANSGTSSIAEHGAILQNSTASPATAAATAAPVPAVATVYNAFSDSRNPVTDYHKVQYTDEEWNDYFKAKDERKKASKNEKVAKKIENKENLRPFANDPNAPRSASRVSAFRKGQEFDKAAAACKKTVGDVNLITTIMKQLKDEELAVRVKNLVAMQVEITPYGRAVNTNANDLGFNFADMLSLAVDLASATGLADADVPIKDKKRMFDQKMEEFDLDFDKFQGYMSQVKVIIDSSSSLDFDGQSASLFDQSPLWDCNRLEVLLQAIAEWALGWPLDSSIDFLKLLYSRVSNIDYNFALPSVWLFGTSAGMPTSNIGCLLSWYFPLQSHAPSESRFVDNILILNFGCVLCSRCFAFNSIIDVDNKTTDGARAFSGRSLFRPWHQGGCTKANCQMQRCPCTAIPNAASIFRIQLKKDHKRGSPATFVPEVQK